MGSANGDAPDDRHKSFLVGSFRLNEERYFEFVFLHFFFCRFFKISFACKGTDEQVFLSDAEK
jgi:hypothetical protein